MHMCSISQFETICTTRCYGISWNIHGQGTVFWIRRIAGSAGVVFEKVPETQPIKEGVDGIQYETHLNLKAKKEEAEQREGELLRQVRLQLDELRAQSAYGRQAFA